MANIPIDIDTLRYLATGVLEALRYLHENNVVHKDLRDTSVYIDRMGVVRLSDYSLDKRLSDMYHSNSLAKTESDFPTIQGRGGKKTDVYRFGILLFSLLKGTIISGEEINLTDIPQVDILYVIVTIDRHVCPELNNFLPDSFERFHFKMSYQR